MTDPIYGGLPSNYDGWCNPHHTQFPVHHFSLTQRIPYMEVNAVAVAIRLSINSEGADQSDGSSALPVCSLQGLACQRLIDYTACSYFYGAAIFCSLFLSVASSSKYIPIICQGFCLVYLINLIWNYFYYIMLAFPLSHFSSWVNAALWQFHS